MHSGQTYIVTGVSSGIGAATCHTLRSQGAKIIGIDRTDTDITDEFFNADLSDQDSIEDLVQRLPSGADGLANIAGVPPTLPPELVLKVNFIGLRHFTLGIVDKLADNASILNLASIAGYRWPEAMVRIRELLAMDFNSDLKAFSDSNNLEDFGKSYFLSKEALIVWTMQNRWTWRDRGIRINSVSPGPVDTQLLKDFVATVDPRVEEGMQIMDRPARPGDVAPVISFMLSAGSGWLRGVDVTADGGLSSHRLSIVHDF